MSTVVPAPVAPSTSAYLDFIEKLPPLLKLVAILLPIVVFVSWGPWSWVLGGVAGVWAATWGGVDALLTVGLAAGGLAYVLNCRWNPYADCKWCKGKPRRRDSQENFHFCLWCRGSGRRTRLGAYAWPKFRAAAD